MDAAVLVPPGVGGTDAAWVSLKEVSLDARLMERNRLVSFGGGAPATMFDVMRTRVIQQMRANNWRRLAITSPGSGSGKTTTCLNLAFSFGRQADMRTIVIEADLRRPSMAQMLGLSEQHLFADVLERKAKAARHLVRHGTNLAFGTNHRPSQNPAELLHSGRVADVLAEIEAQYQPDLMVFDMPPLQGSDDTIGFMGRVDCVLLVAAAGTTTVAQVDLYEQELGAQTNVLGVVLNKCRYLEKAQGYDYDYNS